jgi:hypothetical protein
MGEQRLFAKDKTAAKLLDMPLADFRRLVSAGALPKPVLIADGYERWPIADLTNIMSGQASRTIADQEIEL